MSFGATSWFSSWSSESSLLLFFKRFIVFITLFSLSDNLHLIALRNALSVDNNALMKNLNCMLMVESC